MEFTRHDSRPGPRHGPPLHPQQFFEYGGEITGVRAGTIPDEFMLRITGHRDRIRKCRVLWRSDDTVGVEFTDGATVDADGDREEREHI